MKKVIIASFLGLTIAGGAIAAPAAPYTPIPKTAAKPAPAANPMAEVPANPQPAVLAKVNGTDITKAEIEQTLADITMPNMKGKPVFDKLPFGVQKAFLDRYIEKTLPVNAARKAG